MIDHWDAWCNLIGSLLGVLGGFFLAYDIIGGRKGPLSGMTRSVTYVVLYVIGYTTGLGLRFGLIAGLGLGVIAGLQFYYEARWSRARKKSPPKYFSLLQGTSRSFVFSIALAAITDWKVGILLFPIFLIVLVILDFIHVAPAVERNLCRRLEIRGRQAWGSTTRGVSAGLCCWLVENLAGNSQFCYVVQPWKFGLTLGGTAIFVGAFTPWVEWWVERMSQKWLAAIGIFMVIVGFLLQALPNWIVLLG